jgi:DNA-binding GntR family transcriptional regulator
MRIAAALRHGIEAETIEASTVLPGVKQIAAQYDVSVGTVHRATALLVEEGRIEVVRGRGYRVLAVPASAVDTVSPSDDAVASERDTGQRPTMLDLVLRHRGQVVARFSTEADPTDPDDLAEVLRAAVRRSGGQMHRPPKHPP